jgi:chromosome segregation ATPase
MSLTRIGRPDFPPMARYLDLADCGIGTSGPKVLAKLKDEACMSRLDLAQKRFQAALESLENGAGSVGETLDEAAKGSERIAELQAGREQLQGRIAELEDEIAALSGLTEEVEGRLDGAIGEIRAALAR